MGDISASSSSESNDTIELKAIHPIVVSEESSLTSSPMSSLTVPIITRECDLSSNGSSTTLTELIPRHSSPITFSTGTIQRDCDSTDGPLDDEEIIPDSQITNKVKLKRLKSRLDLNNLSQNEIELKIALYFHICNPLKRWKVERLVPYKLILQVVKTIFLIAQVILFTYSTSNSRFLYLYESGLLFNRLFIKGNNSNSLIKTGYSYTQNDALEQMNYVLESYYSLPNITLGTYGHTLDTNGSIQPVLVTLREYRQADFDLSIGQYAFDPTPVTTTISIPHNASVGNYSLSEHFLSQGIELSFTRLIDLEIMLYLNGVHITREAPQLECYSFIVKVKYIKDNIKSRISYHLKHEYYQISCNNNDETRISVFLICLTILDIIIIIISFLSATFIMHNYRKGFILGKAMGEFYKHKLDINISWFQRITIFSVWHLFTMFSDAFLILGSLLKILFEYDVNIHSVTVRILLGSGLIVQSGAMLRYFSFFKQFNALTRTLSAAAPELIKFLFCTSMLYFAFALCGLIVFGSYNEEMFGNFGNSVEILFALINGDSIWLVFRAFSEDDLYIYIYSRCFVYLFIFLFIYAVLNLFTSLVKTSYDNSTLVDRATTNEVRRFVFSGALTKEGAALRDVTYVNKYVNPEIILAKKKQNIRRVSSTIGDLD